MTMKYNTMKKYLFIILLGVFFFFSACEGEKTHGEDPIEVLNAYYYDYKTYKDSLISSNDTIYNKVGETLTLTIETTSENIEVYSLDNNLVEIKDLKNNVFQCFSKQASSTTIYIIDVLTDKFLRFQLNIAPVTITYNIINSPQITGAETIYTADMEDDSLKNDILIELKDKYSPQKGQLTYTSLTSGEFEITMENEDNSLKGSFTIEEELKFNAYYNEKKYQVNLIKHPNLAYGYYIIQDLTEEFRAKYPSAIITKIEVSSLAIMNRKLF